MGLSSQESTNDQHTTSATPLLAQHHRLDGSAARVAPVDWLHGVDASARPGGGFRAPAALPAAAVRGHQAGEDLSMDLHYDEIAPATSEHIERR